MKTETKNKPAAPEKKHYGMRSILYNNKVAMLFSLLAAFALWIWVSIEKSPVVEVTISAVPVRIDLENSVPAQLNLQTFGQTDYYVDVVVSGKRFVVSALTPEDIVVSAQTNYVDSSGSKSLLLKAAAANSKDFEIMRLSQNYIEVYFDTYKETEFAVLPKISAPSAQTVIDGCILGDVLFSKNTVVVSGPSTEVNKITGVVAETEIAAPLSATTTVQPDIKLQTENAQTLSNVEIHTGDSPITMTMPVLKIVTLPTTVTFKNTPTGYLNDAVPFTVSPSMVEAAVPIEKVEEIKAVSVGTVDFSELDIGNNLFTFKAAEITEYTIPDSKARFKVTVNMSGLTSATFAIPASNISIVSQANGFESTVATEQIGNVRIIGTTDEIAALTNEMIYAEVDLTQTEIQSGEQTVRAKIVIKGSTKAWASGSYFVRVQSIASA